MKRLLRSGALLCFGLAPATLFAQAVPQTADTSGNSLLTGNYFVRQILFTNLTNAGAIGQARSLSGTAAFDGNGHYTFTGQTSDNTTNSGQAQAFNFSGAYSVTSGGLLQMVNPLDPAEIVGGGVGVNAIVGSSTESLDFDLLIGIPAGTGSSNGALQGAYRVGTFDYPQADVTLVRNATFLMTADGQGNLSNLTIAGHAANLNSGNDVSQTISGGSYAIGGQGSGTISFPGPSGATPQSQLVSGTKTLYVSADGNIILGGSLTGYDMLIGIKAFQGSASNSSFQGTYFSAGVDDDASQLSQGMSFPDAFYGSVTSNGLGTAIAAQRINPSDQNTYDYTFDDEFSIASDASVNESFSRFYLGAGGRAVLLVGRSTQYSLALSVQARTLPKTGSVYLNPLGVVNAASYAPITNSISGGELLDLFGEGLSSVTMQAQSLPLPTTLGGVQVSVNGRPAPIFLVTPGQLVIVVPFATTETYATVQVTNNGTKSNAVTVYTNFAAPGMFAVGANGVGAGVITHADGSLVTPTSPAKVGETVIAYATGLGSVTPGVADGAAGPSNPLAVVSGIDVYIDNVLGTVSFAGLAPGFVGLYQINVQVPQNAGPGDVYFDIAGPGVYHSQTIISVQ
jgi:uncharacterized protein (TIGR03437 family)